MQENPEISIVIPLYNEEESLEELSEWISRVMKEHGFTYEVVMVDDGSSDTSWEVVKKIRDKNTNVKGIRFNRNFGKSAALDTGFRASKGKVVITMDADMQDSPDEVPELYRMITEDGYDLVSGWKKKRHDPIGKTIPSKFFNFVTSKISGIKLHDFNCGLKAYDGRVVKNITVYGEMHRYIPLIAKWNGFTKIAEKPVKHYERKYGTTKFGLERFINGFLDLISITFVSRFRKKPMHFFGTLGSISFLLGFIFTVKILWDKVDSVYFSKVPLVRDVTEQPIFFLALVALVIGVQLFLAGFLAELQAMRNHSQREYLVLEKIGIE
ncbi:MAG: glycosyltransferase family 2 protein [Bacteroidota bacterium]